MTFHNISDYILAKEKYEQTPLYCRKGRMYEIVDGKEVEVFSLDRPHYEAPMKQNPDGKNINSGCISTKTK